MALNCSEEQKIGGLLSGQYFCVLTTIKEGTPYPSLVGFIAGENKKELYFATFSHTAKYRNIKSNNNVSVLIDNRINGPEAFKSSMALSVTGTAEDIPPHELNGIRNMYLKKFPELKSFLEAPGCRLIKIISRKFSLIEQFTGGR